MATTVGTAYFQLMPSTEGIQGSISKALQGESTNAGKSTGSTLAQNIGKGLKVGAGALATSTVAMTTGLVAGAKGVSSYGDNVDKMSQKIGISAKSYQQWDYVMQRAGLNVDSLKLGMKTLSSQASNNSDAFQKLGISQKEVANSSKEELFNKTVKALAGMEDSTERTALASKLLGRAGADMAPLLNQGTDAIEDQMKIAEDYGMVMSDDLVKDSATFQDSLTTMGMTMNGLKNRILGEYLPSMTQVTDGLAKLFKGDMSGLEDVSSGIEGFISKMSEQLPTVIEVGTSVLTAVADGIIQNLPQLAMCAVQLISKLATSLISLAPSLLTAGIEIVQELANGVINNASEFMSGFDTLIDDALAWIDTQMPELLNKGVDMIGNLANGILSNMPTIISNIGTIIGGLISVITAALPQFLSAGGNLIGQFLVGIVKNAPSILKSIAGLMTNLIGKVISAIPRILSAGASLIRGLVSGIVKSMPNVVSSIGKIASSIINKIKPLPGQLLSMGKSAITKFASAFTPSTVISKVTNIIKSIISKLKALPGKIGSVLSSIPNKLASAFKFKIPSIKLPHISVSGKLSLSPPNVPKISIKWYRQAMTDPILMNQATLFGVKNGQLLGGGEAGDEIIYGHGALMRDIANATTTNDNDVESLLRAYLPLILDEMNNMQVVLDDGTVAGRIEKRLINNQNRKRMAWQ